MPKFEVTPQSSAANQIREADAWLDMALAELKKLRNYSMAGDAIDTLDRAKDNLINAKEWLRKTGIPQVNPPSINSVRYQQLSLGDYGK